MDFLREKQAIIYTSKKYEEIYRLFNSKFDLSYPKVFTLAAVIGAKVNRKEERNEKGREFRSNYLTRREVFSLYSILLNDNVEIFEKSIEDISSNEYQLKAREIMECYAEGGMSHLVENVFEPYWDGQYLVSDYEKYIQDIAIYILDLNNTVPF